MKTSFEDVYYQTDPFPYYARYSETRLSIVEYPAALLRHCLENGFIEGPIFDFGCSYGTLGALLRTDLGIEGLYHLYEAGRLPEACHRPGPLIVGIDRSRSALASARRSCFVDMGIAMDLNAPGFWAWNSGGAISCSALLGYVGPLGFRTCVDRLAPATAFVTCVTWVADAFLQAMEGSRYRLMRLNQLPVFQRWATEAELRLMPDCLIEKAHRADVFVLSRGPLPENDLGEVVESVRRRRASSAWLAMGHVGGCELTDYRQNH